MLINNLQVKCKTSPEQQKTSWKRPDVYKQLASQMRDLSEKEASQDASQAQDITYVQNGKEIVRKRMD